VAAQVGLHFLPEYPPKAAMGVVAETPDKLEQVHKVVVVEAVGALLVEAAGELFLLT
jgi:hypothetical protein